MFAVTLKTPFLRNQNFPSINNVMPGRGTFSLKTLSFLFDNMELSSTVVFPEPWPERRVVTVAIG